MTLTDNRRIWWLRGLVAIALAVYFLLPYRISSWIPLWLPFLLALATEAQFFISGSRAPAARAVRDAGPQDADLDDLGRGELLRLALPQGGELWVETGEFTGEEVRGWLALTAETLDALPPGSFSVGPLRLGAENEIRPTEAASATRAATRRRPRRLVVSVVILAVVAVLLLVTRPSGWDRLSEGKRAAAEAQFSQLAGRIAGHRVQVRCDRAGHKVGYVQEADGLAEVGGRLAWLTPQVCLELVQLRDGDIRPESAGHAVVVLAHEAWHLRGVSSEGLANCFGYQAGVGVAESLGVSPKTARSMMHEQLATNSSDFADDPAYLVPAGCSHGGTYDLHLDASHFP